MVLTSNHPYAERIQGILNDGSNIQQQLSVFEEWMVLMKIVYLPNQLTNLTGWEGKLNK